MPASKIASKTSTSGPSGPNKNVPNGCKSTNKNVTNRGKWIYGVAMRLDRQVSSESTFEHVKQSFGLTGVEPECICVYRSCICNDRRRATAQFCAPEMYLDRHAWSESTFEHIEHSSGSMGIEREHISLKGGTTIADLNGGPQISYITTGMPHHGCG